MKPDTLTNTELNEIERALRLYFAEGAAEVFAKVKALNEWVDEFEEEEEVEFEEEEVEYEPVGSYYVALQQEFEADQFMSAGWEEEDA